MAIVYDADRKQFQLITEHSGYQIVIGPYGHLLHTHYGRPVHGELRYLLRCDDRGFSGNPYDAGKDRTYSMDALPQEYPGYGNGDFRNPALIVRNGDRSYSVDLRYESHEIVKGKYTLPGLPASYAGGNEEQKGASDCQAPVSGQNVMTLKIHLKDRAGGILVTLLYGVFEEADIITRAVCIANQGVEAIAIEKAASCALDFLAGEYDVIHFHGRHGMERQPERSPLGHGSQVYGSRRGASSHQQNPFLILADNRAQEDMGECYGCMLLYSGNFKAEAEMDQYHQSRLVMGLSDEMFSWNLQPGEEFHTPEAALCFSAEGFHGLSRAYHKFIRMHVCRGRWRDVPRPVLINNWEATYFQFTGEKIIAIAEQAAQLGVEMLVLDDGWFGKRDDDYSGLGDWYVNEEKLGMPLSQVAERIRSLGMKFGLWIEPEMVSEDSDLYREHKDWAFSIPGRQPVRARHQLVLDFSRPEVVEHVFGQIAEVIDAAGVEYIKMDMNRHITDVYSAGAQVQNQGVILHKYVLGVYAFLDKLLNRYPHILIEGCSGGGGRFDAGMLYYTPQIWCSDNTDAIERIRIQHGTSFGYPVSAVGAHVSAVPNHQTGRATEFVTRGVVAMAGSFGYELDLHLITEEEKQLVRRQIQDFRRFWKLIHQGEYYRLTNPAQGGEYAAWEFAGEDGTEALLNVVTLNTQCNPAVEYVRLKGLREESRYCVETILQGGFSEEEKQKDMVCYGSDLMYAGLPIPRLGNEYRAWQVYVRTI